MEGTGDQREVTTPRPQVTAEQEQVRDLGTWRPVLS